MRKSSAELDFFFLDLVAPLGCCVDPDDGGAGLLVSTASASFGRAVIETVTELARIAAAASNGILRMTSLRLRCGAASRTPAYYCLFMLRAAFA